jgi:hypothetical protein
MQPVQERSAGLPTRHNLAEIYALSFVGVALMAAASVTGLVNRDVSFFARKPFVARRNLCHNGLW